MNLKSTLVIGERIDVTLDGATYRSNVQNVLDDQTVIISQISYNAVPIAVNPGHEVQLIYTRANGMFCFAATMQGYEQDGEARLMRMSAAGEVERFQRRLSFRLPLRVPVRVRLPRPGHLLNDKPGVIAAYTVDFSSTGVLVEMAEELELGQQVYIDMSLDGTNTFTIEAQVMRVIHPIDRQDKLQVGFQFSGASPRMQRYLSRYIMQQQIKLAKRS